MLNVFYGENDLLSEIGQVPFNGFPYNAQIDFVISMRQHIAHVIGKCEGQFLMRRDEIRSHALNVFTCFADDFEITNNCILNQIVG